MRIVLAFQPSVAGSMRVINLDYTRIESLVYVPDGTLEAKQGHVKEQIRALSRDVDPTDHMKDAYALLGWDWKD